MTRNKVSQEIIFRLQAIRINLNEALTFFEQTRKIGHGIYTDQTDLDFYEYVGSLAAAAKDTSKMINLYSD